MSWNLAMKWHNHELCFILESIPHVESQQTDSITLDLRFPRYEPEGTIALTDAQIITLDDGLVIDRGNVIVKGPRLQCVGDCTGDSRIGCVTTIDQYLP